MFLSQIDTEQIIQGIKSLKLRHNQAVAILLSDKGRPDLESLVQELRTLDIPFFGGFFPGLIHGFPLNNHVSGCSGNPD